MLKSPSRAGCTESICCIARHSPGYIVCLPERLIIRRVEYCILQRPGQIAQVTQKLIIFDRVHPSAAWPYLVFPDRLVLPKLLRMKQSVRVLI